MTEPLRAVAQAAGLENGVNQYHTPAQATKAPDAASKIEDASKEAVDRTVQALENYIAANDRSLNFTVHEATGQIVVKVISEADGHVIREIPAEEMLNRAAIMEQLEGLLFDKTV